MDNARNILRSQGQSIILDRYGRNNIDGTVNSFRDSPEMFFQKRKENEEHFT